MKQFLQNNWYGGETNDKYIATGQGQVLEATCVDINSKSKYFTTYQSYLPGSWLEKDLGGDIRLMQIMTTSSSTDYNSKYLLFYNNGEIYKHNALAVDTSKNIINAGVIGTKGFIIYDNETIDTWTYNNSADDLGISTLSTGTITGLATINSNFAPFLINGPRLYIASGDTVTVIDTSSTWIVEHTMQITAGGQIRGISKIGDNFNIYANYGLSSKQFIWSGEDENYAYEISWSDRQILNIATINNVDYVVCRDGLYIANGYQPTILYKRTFFSEYTNAIETYRNKIYIPGYKKVYAYQFDKPGFPGNLTSELILPIKEDLGVSSMLILPQEINNNTGEYINSLLIGYNNYYIKNDTQSYIIKHNTGERVSQNGIGGFVTINPIPGLYGDKKESKKIRLGYYLDNTSHKTKNFTYNGTSKDFRFRDSITIFGNTFGTKLSLYVGGITTKPAVGDVYSIQGDNGTIIKELLFESNSKWHGWIEFDMASDTNFNTLDKTLGNITKVSGDGDTTIMRCIGHYGEIVAQFTDNTMNGKAVMYPTDFNEINFTIHITEGGTITANERLWTKVYDFAFLYDNKQNDLG